MFRHFSVLFIPNFFLQGATLVKVFPTIPSVSNIKSNSEDDSFASYFPYSIIITAMIIITIIITF